MKACFQKPLQQIMRQAIVNKLAVRPNGMQHTPQYEERDTKILQAFESSRASQNQVSFRTSRNEEVHGFVDHVESGNNVGAGNQVIVIKTPKGEEVHTPVWSVLGDTMETELNPELSEAESQTFEILKQAELFKTPVHSRDRSLGFPTVKAITLSSSGTPIVQLRLADGRLVNMTLLTASKILQTQATNPAYATLLKARDRATQANRNPFNSNEPHLPAATFPTRSTPIPPMFSRGGDDPTAIPARLENLNLNINGKPVTAAVVGIDIKDQRIQTLTLRTPTHETLLVAPEDISIRLAAHVEENARKTGTGDSFGLNHQQEGVINYEDFARDPGDTLDLQNPFAPPKGDAGTTPAGAIAPIPAINQGLSRFIPKTLNIPQVQSGMMGANPDGSGKSTPQKPINRRVQNMLERSLREGHDLILEVSGEKIQGVVVSFPAEQKVQLRLTTGLKRTIDIAAINPVTIKFAVK